MRIFLSLMLVLFGSFGAASQVFSSIKYGVEHGLPQSQVSAITQDDYGYLWVGTLTGGLARFDGKEFMNFTTALGLVSPAVLSLAWTPDKLWIGTARGLNVMSEGKITQQHLLRGMEVCKLITADTAVWAATNDGGIFLVTAESVRFYSATDGFTDKRVLDFEYDGLNVLWVLTIDGEIYQYKNNKFERFVTLEGVTAQSLCSVGSQLLVGTTNGLITYQVDHDNLIKLKAELPDAVVRDIQMIDQELWLIIQSGLVWKNEHEFQWISSKNGLTNAPILTIFHDKEGILWAGSANAGLFKFLRGPFQRIGFPPGSAEDVVTDIKPLPPDKTLVTTLGKGAFEVWSDNSLHKINLPAGVNNINNAVVLNGKIALATIEAGILISLNNEFVSMPDQPDFATPPFFLTTSDGEVFISDRKTLFRMQKNRIEKVLDSIHVSIIHKTDTAYLLGTNHGLLVWKSGSMQKIKTGLSLDRYRVTSIGYGGHQNLLVGTLGQGLWIFPHGDLYDRSPIHLLPSDHITFLLTENNKLYCGTQRGVCVFEFAEPFAITTKKWLNRHNGLTGIETINETVFLDSLKNLWFGTVNGLFIYDCREHYLLRAKPALSITHVEVSELADSLLAPGWFAKIPPVLPTGSSAITFEFQSVSLLMPVAPRYQHRLIGLSENWSKPSSRNNVRYTNLTPGDYAFEVRVVDDVGVEFDKKAMLFSISKPIWHSWRSRFLFGFVLVMLIWGIIRVRSARTLQRQLQIEINNRELRQELAKDFHDEFGNHLASILFLLQILKAKANALPEEFSQRVALLDRHAHELFFGTKDFIASIDPQHQTLEWMLLSLRDFGDFFFSQTPISFGFTATEPWQRLVRIRSYFSRHIILIIKEAMTNALKHSGASCVDLHISQMGPAIAFVITDNGRGFEPQKYQGSASVGFKSMYDRAKKIGAVLEIHSCSLGTTITLKKEDYAHWAN